MVIVPRLAKQIENHEQPHRETRGMGGMECKGSRTLVQEYDAVKAASGVDRGSR